MPKISINLDNCIGCGICTDICPANVYEIDSNINKAIIINQNACLECQACEIICAYKAINISLLI